MSSESKSVASEATSTFHNKKGFLKSRSENLEDKTNKTTKMPLKGKKDFLLDFDDIDDDPPLQRHVPEKLEVLCQRTGLEKRQIRSFYRAFKNLCPNGAINEPTFKNIYNQIFPLSADANAYAHYTFQALDVNKNGSLTFSELMKELGRLVNGTLQERLLWIFRFYDIEEDGKIERREMSAVIGAIHNLLGGCDSESEKHVTHAFQKLDLNSDGVITIDEFMTSCLNDETICKSFEIFNNW